MNFDFSEEQYAFRDSVRRLLAANPRRPAELAADAAFDRRVWSGLADVGLFASLVPESHGGLGLGLVDICLALEELGGALASPCIVDTLVATDLLVRYGSEELKARWLPGIARGATRIAVALHEPNAGPALCDLCASLEPELGSTKWLFSGTKILVAAPNDADAADAPDTTDLVLLVGSSNLALIESTRAGLTLRPQTSLDLSSRYSQLDAVGVTVAGSEIIRGATAAERLFDTGAFAAAVVMTGIAAKLLATVIDYVKQRNQFGKPIGSFQAIKHRCADMAVALEFSRAAAYYAAWSVATDAPDRPKAVSVAKSFCADASRRVCNESTQLHGGIGFTWDLGLHYYTRRAKLLECLHGDSTFHRRRVLSAALAEAAPSQIEPVGAPGGVLEQVGRLGR